MELLVSKTLARALALKGQGPDLMRAGTPVHSSDAASGACPGCACRGFRVDVSLDNPRVG